LGGNTIINSDGTATFQIGGMAFVDGQTSNKFVNTDVSTSIYNVQLQSGDGLKKNIGYLSTLGAPVPSRLETFSASQVTATTNSTLTVSGASSSLVNKTFYKNGVSTGLQVTSVVNGVVTLNGSYSGFTAGTDVASFGQGVDSSVRTAFTSGQAGAAVTILSDFIPDVKRQVSAIALAFARDVNNVKQKDGTTGITAIFGYKNTTTNGASITTALPDVLASYTASQLMDMADPTSANYRVEIAAVVNGASWDPTLFVSNITAGINTVLSIDATAANAIESKRTNFSTPLSLMTSYVASTISSWKSQDKANVSVAKQLDDRKQSISGVNLDEEAANLVKFQQLYGAASKVMQTANQMFATLLSAMNAA
jgi:flagellar hook-associated protein FlgK